MAAGEFDPSSAVPAPVVFVPLNRGTAENVATPVRVVVLADTNGLVDVTMLFVTSKRFVDPLLAYTPNTSEVPCPAPSLIQDRELPVVLVASYTLSVPVGEVFDGPMPTGPRRAIVIGTRFPA